MKLTAIILLIGCLQVSAMSYGQKVSLTENNAALRSVLHEIEKQTGYQFFFSDNDIKLARPVNVRVSNVVLREAMERCLEGQPFVYEIVGSTVVIKLKEKAGALPASPVDTGKVVHGRVLNDSTGEPIEGANVLVKGTKKGVVTDAGGGFTLKDVPEGAVVEVSFVGYEGYSLRLNGKTTLAIRLKHKAASMLEVVVSKGYYSTTEKLNTGDATTVKAETIAEQPVTDPLLALEGRVPGLYIQQTSGIPGAYSTIRIMGQNSIANGNDPLYVVDGVPFSSQSLTSPDMVGGAVGNPIASVPNGTGQGLSPFNSLNPDDIESITVLKDADATAIYGSRGANGVILITTKHGKSGNTQFDVNAYSGMAQVTRKLKLLNTPQYLEMRHEAFQNDGLKPGARDYDVNGVWDTTRYTDWQKELISNPAHFTNAQLNISGGNQNTQFLAGGGYSTQGVVFPGTFTDKKVNVHFNLIHTSTNQRFHLQLSGSYTNDNSNLPNIDLTKDITFAPDAPALYNEDGTLNWQIHSGTFTFSNPLEYLYINVNSVAGTMMGNSTMSYELFPGLQLKGNIGYTEERMNETNINPAVSYEPPPYNISSNSSTEYATTVFKTWILEPQLSFHRKIVSGSLDALIGGTFQEDTHNSQTLYAAGFTSDALIGNPESASTKEFVGNEYTLYHYAALYGRISYDWQDKYLVNLTARRDGSSRFGPDKRFGNFGAMGIGWLFSNERFVKNAFSALSFGKLRASYGVTGNDQITDYQYLSAYVPLTTTYLGVTGLYPNIIANPYYGWEVVKKLEFGMDLGFLQERILISGIYYRNRDGNQLVGYPLPEVTGFTTVQANFPALVQNSGFEATLNTINIKRKNFSWSSSLNITIPRNRLLSFANIQNSSYYYVYSVGHSIYSSYSFPYKGVNPENGQYTYYSATYKSDTINPKYPTDMAPSKPITQNYYGGFSNRLSYKRFQLDIFLQFVKQLGYNYLYYFKRPGTVNFNQPVAVLSRWRKPGDVTNIGRFSTKGGADPYSDLSASEDVISDASFVRLKNVALSYQLPALWRSSAKVQNARVYLQAQNLFTFTKYPGLDPEIAGLSLPPMRMITGGLQITF